ncbi:hypothetical protein ACFPYN_14145 [Paenisporosarcina macmurdoensis]|uniref:Uncharacterized protein n=1 Tax=Paenisporosarcina macmurdoensis TaxID=212659 RepID=A0ABW1LA49_9BACL
MNKFFTLLVTVVILGIVNLLTAYMFNLNFVDVSIPFGIVAIFITYIFTNKGNAISRQMDMQIQGETGIRMAFANRVASHSFVFIGSIVYFSLSLLTTFFTYKDYFIS